MKHTLFLAIVCLACCRSADADDQQKAQKQLGRVNAMASDTTGRRVVSITMSDMLNMKRSDLVKLRKNLNLSYGSAFIAHQLMINGVDLGLIVARLKSGRTVLDIANESHIDWKQLLSDAKKLNGKIEKALFDHFADPKDDDIRDRTDGYNLLADVVKADTDVSRSEIDEAADVYVRERNLAMQLASRRAGGVTTADSMNFRRDQVRDGAPDAAQLGISKPPK